MAQFDLKLLQQGADALKVDLSEAQAEQMLAYLQLMLRWNAQMNLTAITKPNEMIVQHLLDSMVALPYCQPSTVLDVGSGAGLPGVVLAILAPSWHFVLLDSRAKRITFLRNVVARLGLNNVEAVHARIEDYSPEQKFDTITARAFAPLDKIAQNTRHLLKPNGRIVALKGKIADEEIAQLSLELQQLTQLHKVQVPHMKAARAIVTLN